MIFTIITPGLCLHRFRSDMAEGLLLFFYPDHRPDADEAGDAPSGVPSRTCEHGEHGRLLSRRRRSMRLQINKNYKKTFKNNPSSISLWTWIIKN